MLLRYAGNIYFVRVREKVILEASRHYQILILSLSYHA